MWSYVGFSIFDCSFIYLLSMVYNICVYCIWVFITFLWFFMIVQWLWYCASLFFIDCLVIFVWRGPPTNTGWQCHHPWTGIFWNPKHCSPYLKTVSRYSSFLWLISLVLLLYIPNWVLKLDIPFHPLKHDNVPCVFPIELAIFIHQTGHFWPRPWQRSRRKPPRQQTRPWAEPKSPQRRQGRPLDWTHQTITYIMKHIIFYYIILYCILLYILYYIILYYIILYCILLYILYHFVYCIIYYIILFYIILLYNGFIVYNIMFLFNNYFFDLICYNSFTCILYIILVLHLITMKHQIGQWMTIQIGKQTVNSCLWWVDLIFWGINSQIYSNIRSLLITNRDFTRPGAWHGEES